MSWKNRSTGICIALILFLLVGCSMSTPSISTTAESSVPLTVTLSDIPVQDQQITLRLAVADAEGRPSEPYVLEFIEQVRNLPGGNLTIEPIWDAGADTTPPFEQGVVKAVQEGQYELGLAASRAWDRFGVTSFQAL